MNLLVPEIDKRRARRALAPRQIEDDVLERLFTAASCAPSCFNNQPWRFVAVREEKGLDAVKTFLSKGNAWAKAAPCIILAAAKYDDDCRLDGGRDYALFDTGMAVMNLMLQATKEGLYAHPIAGYKAPELAKAFGLPDGYILITLVIVGYPGDENLLEEDVRVKERSERQRKPLSEVSARDVWNF